MKSNRFYLACYRDNVGSNVAFHVINGKGYTTNLDLAEVLTLEQAQQKFEYCREFEEPLCADRIDELSKWHVDCQYIPCESTHAEDESEGYYGFKAKCWDGNDVYWLQSGGLPTTDFKKAFVHMNPDFSDKSIIWIPKATADQTRRRTFSKILINRRTMITSAGLITPDRVKKQRKAEKRVNSGKTRWNCPCCGRISWQYNPYDFDGCSNINCDQWRSPYRD